MTICVVFHFFCHPLVISLTRYQSIVSSIPGKIIPEHRWGAFQLLWIAQYREHGQVILVKHVKFGIVSTTQTASPMLTMI